MNSALIQPHSTRANIHAHRPKLTHAKRVVDTKKPKSGRIAESPLPRYCL
jgi:hypothetical protein